MQFESITLNDIQYAHDDKQQMMFESFNLQNTQDLSLSVIPLFTLRHVFKFPLVFG